jgi:uncharacterized membrane protein YphA (DoxX/SURF4 family)
MTSTANLRWLLRQIPRAIGLIFVIAGFSKAWDTATLAESLGFYHIPARYLPMLTWSAVVSEILIGQMLLLGLGGRKFVALTVFILIVFCAHLIVILKSNHPPDCGCVGLMFKFESTRSKAIFGLVRNFTMMIGLVAAILWGARVRTLPVYASGAEAT